MRNMAKKLVAILLTVSMLLGMTMQLYATGSEATADDFTRVNLTFDDATDASRFSGSYWSAENGVLKEGTAWGTTYLTELLPLDEQLTVSFDFYIEYTGVWADSFLGFGFMNSDQTAGTFGWVQRTQYGDLLTWRKNGVGGPTSNDGVGDQILRSATLVSEGTTIYGGVHNVKIVLESGTMTIYVDGTKLDCTNGNSVTCDITEGYFTLRATNTSGYIDNLKIVKAGVSDDYSETFADISAFDNSGSVSVDTTNNKFVGSSWSGVTYKLPAENYRLDISFKLNAEMNSANENRLYFGLPTSTSTGNGAGGYLLHFYNNTTWVYDNSVTRNGWYDANAIISKFTTKTNFQNDGEEHTVTLCVYENQFYMLIDGMFFTYSDSSNVYTASEEFGTGYLNFTGHDWEISQFDITCFGGMSDVASAHFTGLRSVYETVEGLDETLYGASTWSTVESIRDEYIAKMDAVKDGSNAEKMATLATEAVTKISAVPTKVVVEESVVGENQVLIGYIVSGGSYNGGLYNFEVGDELPEGVGITAEPVVVTMYMETGAAVRLRDGAGIRWITNISQADYEKLTSLGITFGTRITSTGSDKYVDIPLDKGLNTDSSDYYYTAALINIKEANYTRVFNGCGYVSVTYADGTTDTKMAVSDNNQRTYKYLVTKAYTDVSDTADSEYITAVQKDGKTVYSPYTATQFAFVKDVYEGIIESETTGEGTGAQVHILNISEGEEVLAVDGRGNALSVLLTYEDKNILIDAGRSQTQEIVANYLKSQGVEKLDYIISTHAHDDHISAIPYIIENFDVGTLIYKEADWDVIESTTDHDLFTAMMDAAETKVNSDGSAIKFVQPLEEGHKVELSADTYFQIFNCTEVYEENIKTDLNYYSLQVYFVSGTAKSFFGGDALGLYQNEGMLEHLDKVDVYQAQHHGQGGEYSPEELLEVLQPKATVATSIWASTTIAETQESCGKYGRYYVTGSDGHLVFENTNGHFVLKGDAEDRWDTAQKVTIEETELTFDGNKRTSADGNSVSNSRYVIPGQTTGTALVLKVPENMTQPAVINFDKDMMVYANVTGLRFRIVLNDKVLYDSNVSGLDGNSIEFAFTVKAGDKIYFIAEGATETIHMPMSITIDGKYFCLDNADNIDPADGANFVSKDFFGGRSEKGTYYTCEELLDYMSVTVTDVQ